MRPISKLKKTLLIIFSSIIIIAVIVVIFISPITKYLVEKYDEKYTGRKITMDWAYANPFTGYIHLSNLKIYELNSDSLFFSANSVSINFTLYKLFAKTYEISQLTLDQPRGTVIQNKNDFNFIDLINKFSSKDLKNSGKVTVHFTILSIKIKDGEFYYRQPLIPISYFIKKVNFESKGKQWNTDTIAARFSFLPGIGSGDVKGDFTINLKTMLYRYNLIVHNLDLNIIEQYLKDLTNYGNFSAKLDANIKSKGNLNDAEDVTIKGTLQINDFRFGKNSKNDYASFDKLILAINELSPKNNKYLFDSVLLSHPYLKYEIYDSLDNFQTIFGKNGSNISNANTVGAKFNLVIEIAQYVKILAKNFFESYYQVNHLAIKGGDIKFNDFSMSEKFSMDLTPFNVTADSIDKNHKRVDVLFKSGFKPYGEAAVNLSINPKDSGTFDIQYNFQKFPASIFNPYTIAYTSFPLDRGTIEAHGTWNVKNGIIQSENHLIIIDPRVTKRIRNKDTKWLPLPLIMSFIRERGNVIDYEIPITGNLKNPKFHLSDVIFDVLKNIFVKPATTSYRLEVKNVETEIEKSLTLKWEMRNASLQATQLKFIEKMADFLLKNPDASINILPNLYEQKEKEYILFFEAKKKYFLSAKNKNIETFNNVDSEMVANMTIKDPLFTKYIEKQVNDSLVFTIQEKCARIIDKSIVDTKFEQLNNDRKEALLFYFKNKNVEKQIKFLQAENVIPYNGFTFYKIIYKGDFPEPLITAYQQMNELNEKVPRDKFKNERKKNKGTL